MVQTHAIGIDLGTTYSCVGVFMNGKVEIIANECGERTTPSVVAFTNEEKLVGASAAAQMNSNPTNTVFDAKRLIGRRFTDAHVQADMKHWPFTVEADSATGQCQVKVNYRGEIKYFHPEQISAFVLEKMKQVAENQLGTTVSKAVVTVPAYFNDSQRQSTIDAGKLANLQVLRIINEPTAAALAYGLEKKTQENDTSTNILVYDLGGGTFDVSILSIEGGMFEVKSTGGDTHLGGEDFDNLLVSHCAAEFKKSTGVDITKEGKAMRRLRTACEKFKRSLSASTSVTVSVDSIIQDHDLSIVVSRAKFENLCDAMFKSTIDAVTKCLTDAKMDKSAINCVVLVGGSTRIPKIQQLLSSYLPTVEICKAINPDEAVAYGAAVQAAILSGSDSEVLQDVLLLDVTPLDTGIATAGEVMTPLVTRNTTLPTQKSQVFTTAADNQTSVSIRVYQGNRKFVGDNHFLGSFELTGIRPAPRGVPQIEVKFDVDANSVLHVTAEDKQTGAKSSITITDGNRPSDEEIERMRKDAEAFRKQDEERVGFVHSINELEGLCHAITSSLSDQSASSISESDKKKVQDKISEIEQWVAVERKTNNPIEGKAKVDAKKKELEQLWYPMAGAQPGAAGAAGAPFGGAASASQGAGPSSGAGPTIEEVD